MVVDHCDAAVLNGFLESLTIRSVADTLYGMPAMSSWLLLNALHQDLVGRATDRITFTPVQIVDTPTSHAAKPATWFDKNDIRPFFASGQGCHNATRSAAIHTNVYVMTWNVCGDASVGAKESKENN